MRRNFGSPAGLLLLAGVAAISFSLGFLAHRAKIQEPFRPLAAWLAGDTGGCGLPAMMRLRDRRENLERAKETSRASTRRLETAPDGFSRWQTPLGALWCPPKNDPVFAVGEQLAGVYTEGKMALGPGDVVLDGGANIGDFVKTCLQAGVDKVVAIDPNPGNVEAMRRSFAGEIARGRVAVVPKGVWHEETVLNMTVYENTLLDSFVMRDRWENRGSPPPQQIQLPVTTVDKIVEELKLERVTFLKLDVEGAERHAIRGAAGTIRRFRPRMALATENLEDDYVVVPREVAKVVGDYDVECGLCRKVGPLAYRPDVLYFLPR